MFCPACNHKLTPYSLKGDVNTVDVYYCHTCGGIWSDAAINFISETKLEFLRNLLPENPNVTTQEFVCPNDRQGLVRFQEESIPTDVDVFQCGKCRGYWFPSGMVFRFKKAQEVKRDYFKAWHIPLPSVYAILLPLLFIAIIGGGLVATLSGLNQSQDTRIQAQDLITKPLVLHPQPDEVLIHFTTKMAAVAKIKYWVNPNEVTETWSSTTAKTQHTLVLKNLEQNTTYFYQIVILSPQDFTSRIYTFSTKVEANE